MRKIRRSDEVVVISGRDRGSRGQVLEVRKDGRLMVSGVNIVKKHTRPNPQANVQGGIIEREAPIQVSNVAIWNRTTQKADRVGFRFDEEGRKQRFFKSNQELID